MLKTTPTQFLVKYHKVKLGVQLDEVSALNQSVILLEQKLTEAEAARLDLISNR